MSYEKIATAYGILALVCVPIYYLAPSSLKASDRLGREPTREQMDSRKNTPTRVSCATNDLSSLMTNDNPIVDGE